MIALFQHGTGEPPGYILQLMRERDLEYKIIPLFETGEVPGKINATHMVFLGGQMSVNDEKEYPWLLQEKQLIRQAIRSGTPVLGICLGAQLIASALGKKVFPCQEEKGWCEISKNLPSGSAMPGNNLTVFQWHGENFDFPTGPCWNTGVTWWKTRCLPLDLQRVCSSIRKLPRRLFMTGLLPAGRKQKDEIMLQTSRHIIDSNQICRSIFTRFLTGSTV